MVPGGEEFWLTMIGGLIALAIVVFLRIQSYMEDPRRAEFNERWFAQFEDQLRRRYRDRELLWRTYALDGQFQGRRRPRRER